MDRQRVSTKIQEELAADEDIVAVYLFGSLAQDRAHTLSDVEWAWYSGTIWVGRGCFDAYWRLEPDWKRRYRRRSMS